MKSKFRGILDTFAACEFIYNDSNKGDLKFLQDASILQKYTYIKEGLCNQSVANVMMEVYLRHLYGPETSLPLFELLRYNLESLDRAKLSPYQLKLLLCDFLIQFFGLLGFRPQFLNCAHCGSLVRQNASRFDIEMGGPVCRPCEKHIHFQSTYLPKNLFLWLEDVMRQGEGAFTAAPYILQQAEKLLLEFLYAHSSRRSKLKSLAFYRQLLP